MLDIQYIPYVSYALLILQKLHMNIFIMEKIRIMLQVQHEPLISQIHVGHRIVFIHMIEIYMVFILCTFYFVDSYMTKNYLQMEIKIKLKHVHLILQIHVGHRNSFIHMLQIEILFRRLCRTSKGQDPGIQDPGHFLEKLRTFLVEIKNYLKILSIFNERKTCLCK